MKKIKYSVLLTLILFISGCVKINNLYDRYELLEVKVLGLESEISQLTSALNSTTQALETATANYNSLQSSSDIQVSQLLSLIANLQDEKDGLEDELNLVKSSLVQLQIDVTGLTGDNNNLLETIASLTAQIEALEQASGSSTDTTSNTVSDIDFPDYKSQGHTLRAIGVWQLYSVKGAPVNEDNRFNILIYPDSFNPNLLLDDADYRLNGWMDFNTTKKIAWQASGYGAIRSGSYPNIEGDGLGGTFNMVLNESNIIGISKDQGVYVVYTPESEKYGQEFIYLDFEPNDTDSDVFPELLVRAIFHRLK